MRGRVRISALAIAILDIVGVAVLVASCVLAVLIGFLFKGPLPIDFLAPQLQTRLASLFPTLTLAPTSVVLRLDSANGRLAISVQGLKVSGGPLGQQATIDQLDVSLSPWSLMRGEVTLDEIAAEGAVLRLVRSATGKLTLQAAEASREDPVSALAALLSQFDHSAAKLPGFSLSNAKLLLPATTGPAPAELIIHRLDAAVSGSRVQFTIDAAVPTRNGAGRLLAAASILRPATEATFRATMTALSPAVMEHWLAHTPAWLPPAISGGIEGVFNLETGNASGKFTIVAPDYSIAGAAETELKIAGLQVAGRIDTAIPLVVVESVYADVGAGRITAAALMTDTASGPQLKLNVNAQDLRIAEIAPIFAPNAAPARGIVTSLAMQVAGSVSPTGFVLDANSIRCKAILSAGRLEMGKTTLSSIEGALACEDGALNFDLSNARFNFPDGPPIDNIVGSGRFSRAADGISAVTLRIASAKAGNVKITNGAFTAQLADALHQIDADLPVSGTPASVMEALSTRVSALRDARQSIRLTGGSAAGRLKITTSSNGPTHTSLDLEIKNAELAGDHLPPLGIDLARLRYADDRLHGSGRLSMAGATADFELGYESRNARSEITAALNGEISASKLPSPLAGLRPYLKGSVRHQAKLRYAPGAEPSIAVEVDLANAALDISPIRWRKAQRSPGTLRAVAYRAVDGGWRFEEIRLNAGDMDLAGTAALQPDGQPRQVRLTRIRFGGAEGTHGTVEYSRDPGRPARLTVSAERLDARPYIEEPSLIDRATEISIRAGSMRIADTGTITNATVRGSHDGATWKTLSADGSMPGGGTLRLQLESVPERPGATVYADNAASFMALLVPSLGNGVLSGGEVAVTLDQPFAAGDSAAQRTGRIAIRDLTINKAMPLPASMSRILSLADFSDLLRRTKTRIPAAEAQFTKNGSLLRFAEFFAYTDAIAFMASGAVDTDHASVDATGEIAPYAIVQRLVTQAPFTGAFVSSADKSGLVSLPFTLTGPLATPDFSAGDGLQPIQPGRLRDLVKTVSRPLDLSIERRLPAAGNR